MVYPTDTELKDRIKAVIKTNGVGGITGQIEQDVFVDFVDSVAAWINNLTFDPTALLAVIEKLQGVTTPIDADDLDENNTITVVHNLSSVMPFVQVSDASGNLYNPSNYSISNVQASQYNITFAEAANFTVKTKA